MTSNYSKAADHLHQQAGAVLQHLQLPTLIEKMGQLHLTGSYALNLMTWNDIDMQITLKKELSPTKALMQLLDAFVHQKAFVKGQIINFSDDYKPQYPRGYCLTLKMNLPEIGGVWKFDIWVLRQKDLEENHALVKKLEAAMNPQAREIILEIKNTLMKRSGRVPKMGSYWLYQAVLLHGILEKRAILEFLGKKGVSIE